MRRRGSAFITVGRVVAVWDRLLRRPSSRRDLPNRHEPAFSDLEARIAATSRAVRRKRRLQRVVSSMILLALAAAVLAGFLLSSDFQIVP